VTFIRDFASAVLDKETGDLLEYHHLLKHPKYKDIWSKSFGTEIRRLATTTEMIAFMNKEMIHRTDARISRTVALCAPIAQRKRINTAPA